MEVRKQGLYMDVLILRAHGCAKAGFVHGRAYIGSVACVEKSKQWQYYRSHMVLSYLQSSALTSVAQ